MKTLLRWLWHCFCAWLEALGDKAINDESSNRLPRLTSQSTRLPARHMRVLQARWRRVGPRCCRFRISLAGVV